MFLDRRPGHASWRGGLVRAQLVSFPREGRAAAFRGSMQVRIRILERKEDVLRVAETFQPWADESASQLTGDALASGAVERLLERHREDPRTLVAVAGLEPGEPAIGGLLALPLEDPLSGEREPLIVVLHVDVRFRHRGVARALVEAATEEFSRRGFSRVLARAGHNDDALISMGERWGFVRDWELMARE